MNARSHAGRPARIAALLALATSGSVALAAPAVASSALGATLTNGTVTVTGTPARDVIAITVDALGVAVDFGSDGTVDAQFARSQVTQVQVFAGDGDDRVDVTGTGVLPMTVNGGTGSDGIGVVGNFGETGLGDAPTTVNGDAGNDRLTAATPGPVTVNAGSGDDRVNDGGAGVGLEKVSLGDGDDRFVSSLDDFLGARTDVVNGGAGRNTMVVNGTFDSETVTLSAEAGHLIVERDLRDRIDANNVQAVKWFGFGGPGANGSGDQITVGDLSGTDVTNVTPNFSAAKDAASPNDSADVLTVSGRSTDGTITVSGSGARITVAGLAATVTPVLLDAQDTLRIETAGQDVVDRSGLPRGLVHFRVL